MSKAPRERVIVFRFCDMSVGLELLKIYMGREAVNYRTFSASLSDLDAAIESLGKMVEVRDE